jgi:probable HAF family extracellular repeat protein
MPVLSGINSLACIAVCAVAASAFGQEFVGLGFLPGGTSYSVAYGVSGTGDVVVGQSQPGRAFRWSESTGMVDLGLLPGSFSSLARACSDDGSVVVGECFEPGVGTRAFRWTAATGMVDLGSLGAGPENVAFGVTLSGDTAVGHTSTAQGFRAFRWIAGSGMSDLGVLPGHSASFATGVSASGEVVVGRSSGGSQLRAFLWSMTGGMQELMPLSGMTTAQAMGVSCDGLCAVGKSGAPNRAVRWIAPESVQELASLPETLDAVAYATSIAGLVIVGDSSSAEGPVPFIWTEHRGMRSLSELLGAVVPSGWRPTNLRGISVDGSVVVGYAQNPAGGTEAFRAVLPASAIPCYPNCDGSSVAPHLNVNDFACFFNRFVSAHPVRQLRRLHRVTGVEHQRLRLLPTAIRRGMLVGIPRWG